MYKTVITLDNGVLLLVVILFAREALNLMRLLCSPKEPLSGFQNIGIIRPLSFLFFIATDLSVSFIPLAMKGLNTSSLGLPSSLLPGLPISAEMFCAGITTLFSGYTIDAKGWKQPFFIGIGFLMTGAFISGLTESQDIFILSRGIVGVGYGFSWMAMRGYVAACRTQASKARGFSQLNAGIYAGNICACVIGGRLAEAFGLSVVFFITACILVLTAVFALFVKDPPAEARLSTLGKVLQFTGNRSVLSLCFFITIPSAICLAGFLNSFFPVFARCNGCTPSDIGNAFMIYGCCIIFFGPYIGKTIAKNPAYLKTFIVLGSATGAASMLVFSALGTIWTALIAIAMLGIADCIGFISQNTYFLSLKATRTFGEGKALGLFSMTKKVGQMLGPLAFGWAAASGTTANIGLVGLAYCFTIALFVLYLSLSNKSAVSAPQSSA